MKTIQIFSKSLTGKFKNKNQDTFVYVVNSQKQILLAVADGVSSYDNSGLASQIVCKILKTHFQKTIFSDDVDVLKWFKTVVLTDIRKKLNALIGKAATTLTAVFLFKNKFYFLHIGDTRLYQFKKSKKQLLQLSRDHNFASDANDTVSWLKGKKYLQNSLSNYRDCYIDFYAFMLTDGYLLLTTDGLHDFVNFAMFQQILADDKLDEKVKIEIFFNQAITAGSLDDITCLLVKMS